MPPTATVIGNVTIGISATETSDSAVIPRLDRGIQRPFHYLAPASLKNSTYPQALFSR